MADSNIDAQQTAQSLLNSTEQILKMLYEELSKDRTSDKEKKLMQQFIKGTGPVMGSSVLQSHAKEVKEELEKQNIPFIAVPGGNINGGVLFLIRKESEALLYAIEEAVAAKDTNLSKELSIDRGVQVLKTQNVKNAVTLSFNDVEMAEIAKQKLFQSGSVFMSLPQEDKTKLVIFPSSLYKENGKDIEFFKLNYALTQARGSDMFKSDTDIESELIRVRKMQSKYDKETVENFIRDARQGKSVVLGDVRGNGSTYLEAKDGHILIQNKDKGTTQEIEYLKDDSMSVLYATLSRHTEKISNMAEFDTNFYEETLKDQRVYIKNLPEKYIDYMDIPNKSGEMERKPVYKRPALYGKNANLQRMFNTQLETMMSQINIEAMKRAEATKGFILLSAEQKAALKHQEIIHLLKDNEYEPIATFLNDDEYNTSVEMRRELLDNITENFSNESQNTQYSVDVNQISIKELEAYAQQERDYAKESYNSPANEQQYENDLD